MASPPPARPARFFAARLGIEDPARAPSTPDSPVRREGGEQENAPSATTTAGRAPGARPAAGELRGGAPAGELCGGWLQGGGLPLGAAGRGSSLQGQRRGAPLSDPWPAPAPGGHGDPAGALLAAPGLEAVWGALGETSAVRERSCPAAQLASLGVGHSTGAEAYAGRTGLCGTAGLGLMQLGGQGVTHRPPLPPSVAPDAAVHADHPAAHLGQHAGSMAGQSEGAEGARGLHTAADPRVLDALLAQLLQHFGASGGAGAHASAAATGQHAPAVVSPALPLGVPRGQAHAAPEVLLSAFLGSEASRSAEAGGVAEAREDKRLRTQGVGLAAWPDAAPAASGAEAPGQSSSSGSRDASSVSLVLELALALAGRSARRVPSASSIQDPSSQAGCDPASVALSCQTAEARSSPTRDNDADEADRSTKAGGQACQSRGQASASPDIKALKKLFSARLEALSGVEAGAVKEEASQPHEGGQLVPRPGPGAMALRGQLRHTELGTGSGSEFPPGCFLRASSSVFNAVIPRGSGAKRQLALQHAADGTLCPAGVSRSPVVISFGGAHALPLGAAQTQVLRKRLTLAAEALEKKDMASFEDLLQQLRPCGKPKGEPIERLVHYAVQGLGLRCAARGMRRSNEPLRRKGEDVGKSRPFFEVRSPLNVFFVTTTALVLFKYLAGKGDAHVIDFGPFAAAQWLKAFELFAAHPGSAPRRIHVTLVDLSQAVFPRPRAMLAITAYHAYTTYIQDAAQALGISFSFARLEMRERILPTLRSTLARAGDETILVLTSFNLALLPAVGSQAVGPRDALLQWVRQLQPDALVASEQPMDTCSRPFLERFQACLEYYLSHFEINEFVLTQVSERNPLRLWEELIAASFFINIVSCEGEELLVQPESMAKLRGRLVRAGFSPQPWDADSAQAAAHCLESCNRNCRVVLENEAMSLNWQGVDHIGVIVGHCA